MTKKKYETRPIAEQLKGRVKGKECDHPKAVVTTGKNSKGRKFRECMVCGAFLGWC